MLIPLLAFSLGALVTLAVIFARDNAAERARLVEQERWRGLKRWARRAGPYAKTGRAG